jgi:hypothetical protein
MSDVIDLRVSESGNCTSALTVSLMAFRMWVQADTENPFAGTIFQSCASFSEGWSNAASKSLTRPVHLYFPATRVLSSANCPASANYRHLDASNAGGFGYSLASGSSAVRCVPSLDGFDQTWTYDVQYVDTSGSSPQEQTLSGALTLRIESVA